MNYLENQLLLIKSIEDVINNVKAFNEDLDSCEPLISILSSFRHWYYIEELDLFGPSKFVGYKGNSYNEYIKGSRSYMCGTETQHLLAKLFNDVAYINESKAENLHGKLEFFLGEYDKKPNKRAVIYIKK